MKRILLWVAGIAGILCIILWTRQSEWIKDELEEEEEKETGVEKQLAMWWWSRAYPYPENINEKYYDAWLQAKAMQQPAGNDPASRLNGVNGFSGNWMSIGPSTQIGGRILSIAIHPVNSNIIFIGSASGGLWKSINSGNSWQPVRTGFPVLGVSALLIDPNSPDIMYAGTGEVYRTDNSNIGFNVWKARGTYGVGILKSLDGGITWTQVFNKQLSELTAVQMMAFDPANSNIVYACTTQGLYRSNNGGNTWSLLLNKTYITDIAIHPSNSNILVAGVGNLVNADKGIYRSTNGGSTWSKVTSGLPASFSGFIRLANNTGGRLYASIGRDDSNENELYLSNDFGATWISKSGSHHCEYQFWCAHDLAVDPSNQDRVIMGGVNLYSYTSTSSTGSNGSRSTIGSNVHADIHAIAYDPTNNNTLYIACDGGMYRSTNNGASFTNINNGLHAVQFYASMAVSPSNPNILVGGLQDNGVVRYNGATWSTLFGGDGGPCMYNPNDANILFASNDARSLRRSGNGGGSFSNVLSSWAFVADDRTGFMAPIAISKSNPSYVYCASDNLHRSVNGGVTWTNNNYSSATNYIEARYKTGVALAVSPLNPDKVFVSTSPFSQKTDNDLNNNPPANLLKTTNGGASFTSIKGTLPDRFVMDFAIHPNNDDSVLIVLGGYGTSHVYVTANGGVSWTSIGTGLPDVPHNAIMLDPIDPEIIYVGNDLGIYMSPDNGNTWYDFNNALWDATMVMDLQPMGLTRMVAATHGKGAFISDLFAKELPVTLLAFSGNYKEDHNVLEWTTSMEENTSHFEIERSRPGMAFEKIGQVTAGRSDYRYNDPVKTADAGTTFYYRLKIVGRDGSFTYSNMVILRIPGITSFRVAGNPFRESFSIRWNGQGGQTAQLQLFDATGRCMLKKNVISQVGNNNLTINQLSHLPPATYLLDFQCGDSHFSQKLVKH